MAVAHVSVTNRITLLVAVLSLVGMMFTEYFHSSINYEKRISALEAHQTDTDQHFQSIESKLDRLVQWALGDGSSKTR